MMKKVWRMLLLAGVFTVLLCVSALAAGEGICEVRGNLTPLTAEGGEVTESAGVYVGAKKVALTYSPAKKDSYYLVMVLNDDSKVPTVSDIKSNIAYIDQVTADESGSVSFTVYPDKLENDKTYKVYLASNDGELNTLTEQGSFKYYVPYTLGDVNNDTFVDSQDALQVLRFSVKLDTPTEVQRLAANVVKDTAIDSQDALKILRFSVNLITSWD